MKQEHADELGCIECVWYRPYAIACGYVMCGQIIDKSVEGVLICNKKKPYRTDTEWVETLNKDKSRHRCL